jgi:hypothetical protein
VVHDRLIVLEGPRTLSFGYEEILAFHGGGSPGGVAHAFKVLERSLPLLEPGGPAQRREIVIATAFGGPGARDALEHVTRAVSDGRFAVEASLQRAELGLARERFVFHLRYGERKVTCVLRDGYVTEEFIRLTRRPDRTPDEEDRLTAMKSEMAARVMAASAESVYDVS